MLSFVGLGLVVIVFCVLLWFCLFASDCWVAYGCLYGACAFRFLLVDWLWYWFVWLTCLWFAWF